MTKRKRIRNRVPVRGRPCLPHNRKPNFDPLMVAWPLPIEVSRILVKYEAEAARYVAAGISSPL